MINIVLNKTIYNACFYISFPQMNSIVPQNMLQSIVQQTAATPVTQQQASPAVAAGSSTPVSAVAAAGIPQMLFLNQVTINGQTSFVLVDANNKPVQLPQGTYY